MQNTFSYKIYIDIVLIGVSGETVESLFKKPEDVIAKKSEIPHASKKEDVAKAETGGKNETAKPEATKQGESAKKDFLQQPFMMMQQPQAAFQTTSQFGGEQGGQNAAYGQSAPAMVAPPEANPSFISQPAAAVAPVAIPGTDSCYL